MGSSSSTLADSFGDSPFPRIFFKSAIPPFMYVSTCLGLAAALICKPKFLDQRHGHGHGAMAHGRGHRRGCDCGALRMAHGAWPTRGNWPSTHQTGTSWTLFHQVPYSDAVLGIVRT